MKKFAYFYIFILLTKLDKLICKREPKMPLRPSGISHSRCTKGNLYHYKCKCGSSNGRC